MPQPALSFADDPLAVAMRLRAVAEEGDCQLVAYLFREWEG